MGHPPTTHSTCATTHPIARRGSSVARAAGAVVVPRTMPAPRIAARITSSASPEASVRRGCAASRSHTTRPAECACRIIQELPAGRLGAKSPSHAAAGSQTPDPVAACPQAPTAPPAAQTASPCSNATIAQIAEATSAAGSYWALRGAGAPALERRWPWPVRPSRTAHPRGPVPAACCNATTGARQARVPESSATPTEPGVRATGSEGGHSAPRTTPSSLRRAPGLVAAERQSRSESGPVNGEREREL